MRLYRITKSKSPIYYSPSGHYKSNSWIDDEKRIRRDETQARTGVDIKGPGRWFTSDIHELDFYINDRSDDAVVTYVDIPDELAPEFSTNNIMNGTATNPPISRENLKIVFNTNGPSGKDTEYYLPLEWAEKARILCTAKELKDSNFNTNLFTEHRKLSILSFIQLF